MAVECIFGDWGYDPLAPTVAAYRSDSIFPLTWNGGQISTVHPADGLVETVPYVALAAHWGQAHPGLLEAIVGPFEMSGFPRSTALL